MKTSQEWIAALKPYENEEKKKVLSQFFKTGKGEYGESDVMVGICVPDNRRVARTAALSDLTVIEEMLTHEVHEYRLSALLALVERYKKAAATDKEEIVRFYLSHTACINNWDLVDLSAPYILGAEMLRTSDITPALRLAESTDMWQQRIAIVSMLTFIRAGRFDTPLQIVTQLLHTPHDLLRKANGWALRELGKQNEALLCQFLEQHAATMPRTTLRYAIERLDPDRKRHYMTLKN